jgi:Sortase domain
VNWRPVLAGVLAVGAISTIGIATVDSTSTVAPPAAASTTPSSAAPKPATAAPISIAIPQIGVQALLGPPVGLNPDGSVQVPDVNTPDVPAYYSPGAKPGDPGNAVILGHVDGRSMTGSGVELGVFHSLSLLQPGAQIKIGRADGSTVTYAVTRVEVVRKTDFPFAAVFGPTSESWLQLVSCFGKFDPASKQYLDSILVFSKLVP